MYEHTHSRSLALMVTVAYRIETCSILDCLMYSGLNSLQVLCTLANNNNDNNNNHIITVAYTCSKYLILKCSLFMHYMYVYYSISTVHYCALLLVEEVSSRMITGLMIGVLLMLVEVLVLMKSRL